MKTGTKTALGVDISQTHISLALLKKDSKGIRLIKAARCPIPEGAIQEGNVKEPAAVLKAIRDLKARSRIRERAAAMSLPADSVIMQIVDLPKQIPANIGQFVQDEVKQYVALSGEKIVSDYCAIPSAVDGNNRILIAAAERHKIDQLIKICSRAGINVEAVEQPALAYIRACYKRKIAGKLNHNILLALLFDNVLVLCVFRRQILDLVRTKNLPAMKDNHQDFVNRLAEEITDVTQSYDIEIPGEAENWQITVVASQTAEPPETIEQVLKTKFQDADLQVRNLQDAYKDTLIGENLTSQVPPSAAAIGLAMRLLSTEDSLFKVNLLPRETIEIRSFKRHLLLTGNLVAVVLLITILIVHSLSATISKINQNIQRKVQAQPPQATSTLANQERLLEQQIQQLSEGPRVLGELMSVRRDIGWAKLLNDIQNAAPGTVCITKLISTGNRTMTLEGLATSYDAANLFVSTLEKSEHIQSASLTEAQKNESQPRLINYQIECSLTPQKRKASSVN
jgi:Tfp pilus assembly protein PilN